MNPARVQLRSLFDQLPPDVTRITRPSRVVGQHGTRQEVVNWFALYLADNLMPVPAVQAPQRSIYRLAYIRANRGRLRRVACFCAPDEPCHGDVLLAEAIANQHPG